MTKEAFQQELKEKIKPGVKASDLKKLKRSKSADDIPSAPPSPAVKIKNLEDKISVLELKLETKDRELTEKDGTIAVYLKEKQKEVEELRKQLGEKSTELSTLKREQSSLLDQNLTLKHQSLKDWFKQYQQTQQLEQELKENIDYASEELVEQDKQISRLQSSNRKLKQEKQSLEKDLDLAHKLVELRKSPLPFSEGSFPWTVYALTFCLIGTVLWLTIK